jgi:hypothetical protein
MARFSLRPQFPAQTPGAGRHQASDLARAQKPHSAARLQPHAVLDSRSDACCGGRELRFTSGAHKAVSRAAAHTSEGGALSPYAHGAYVRSPSQCCRTSNIEARAIAKLGSFSNFTHEPFPGQR